MDGRRVDMDEGACQEDVAQPMDGVEPGSEADVAPPLIEPNVTQLEDESPYPRWSSR